MNKSKNDYKSTERMDFSKKRQMQENYINAQIYHLSYENDDKKKGVKEMTEEMAKIKNEIRLKKIIKMFKVNPVSETKKRNRKSQMT